MISPLYAAWNVATPQKVASASLPVQQEVAAQPADQATLGQSQAALMAAPPSAPSGQPQLRGARLAENTFSKFMKYRKFDLEVERGGKVETSRVGILNGPGHDVAAVASMVLDPQGHPQLLLKTGDTRVSRSLRGDDYVKIGSVAGRLDKVGADFAKIGLAELSEEVGGVVVGDSLRRLGEALSPTMPHESTECDACFFSLVELKGQAHGDGGGMEVTDLIGPAFFTPQQGLAAMESGQIGDSGRCQMLYARALDAIGYIPELGTYVHDHPELGSRFSTLGLGQAADPRSQASGAPIPPPPPAGTTLESQINHGYFEECQEVALGDGARLLDGKSRHAVAATPVGNPVPNQLLSLPYDRAKVVHFVHDPQRGPLVRFTEQERPVLAVRQLELQKECPAAKDAPAWIRGDVDEVQLDRGKPAREQIDSRAVALGAPTTASAGQSDLKIHFYAVAETPGSATANYIPLSEALQRCREGQGDAQTEASLLRLARQLEWIPGLQMSVDQARQLLQSRRS